MRIINIDNRSVICKRIGLIVCFLFLTLSSGCIWGSDLRRAQNYTRQSRQYYLYAVNDYKNLIKKGNNLNKLYFELGVLYFNHGDFDAAKDVLARTGLPLAKKLLAISDYRVSNFTDALDIFSRYPITDDEYLYYHGLTCEKLNLFDEALEIYSRIKGADFSPKASQRIRIIKAEAGLNFIRNVNPETDNIISAAPLEKNYPQAGALILSCEENTEITPENTEVSGLHYIIKILNERGKENYSEAHIEYDTTYEKVELEYARTIKPDGTVAQVGSRNIRDVSKYLNFPLYSNVHVFIISFPEVSEGAVVEYKLKLYRSQLVNKKDFVLDYPLQATDPVIAANFTLSVPNDKTLHLKIINDKYNTFGAVLKPTIEQSGSRTIYKWHFRNIPQIVPEANMPPNLEVNPAVLMSTFSNWQDIYDWWWNLAKDRISADGPIKEKVIELVKDKVLDKEKAAAIYNYCAQNIRYVAVEYGQAGYQPHYAGDIFKNKYGDCKDQAILLITMLREAGLAAWPVLISTRQYYDLYADFPAIFFNHCIAAVHIGERTIFLDPTASTCSFADLPSADQMRNVFVVKTDGYQVQQTPLYAAEHNRVSQRLAIKVDAAENIMARKSIFTRGAYDTAQRYWLLYTPPDLIEDTLQEKIQTVSIGARLKSYEIENLDNLNAPVILRYAFSGPEYFTQAGPLRILPQLAESDTSIVAKDKRKYPIDFGMLDSREIIFNIEIPPTFVVKYIPESINQDSPWLQLKAEYRRLGNMIYFRQRLTLKKVAVAEKEYPEFKKFFENTARLVKQRIVLEKKE